MKRCYCRTDWRSERALLQSPGIGASQIPFLLALAIFFPASIAQAEGHRLTIIHTNDLQSRLLGYAPNSEYTPSQTGDDSTIGGIARVATLIRQIRSRDPENTLVVDAGDVMMGTLFHVLSREVALEYRLLRLIGYDAVAIGNHEFDFRPRGLARTIQTASLQGSPSLLLSNALFDSRDGSDDSLKELAARGALKRSLVLRRGGLKIGLFGLMGVDAADVAPNAAPVSFADPVQTALELASRLRQEEKVDLVVCLSHGGVRRDRSGNWYGEDLALARVPGIDVVVGGHTHTPLAKPIMVGEVPVVQAGSESRYVGVLELEIHDGKARVTRYELLPVDDSAAAAPDIQAILDEAEKQIDLRFLASEGVSFRTIVLETGFDLLLDEDSLESSNLGPLVADAIRWRIGKILTEAGAPGTRVDIALTAAGLVRDNLLVGRQGRQQVSDIFRLLPLGIGTVEESAGYPLAVVYLTAAELRGVLEVLTLAYEEKGADYFPYFSGIRFRYNPHRLPLDRIYEIEIGDPDRGYRALDRDNKKLYGIAMDTYIQGFFSLIEESSFGLFSVVPKNAAGDPLRNDEEALVDANPDLPGIQEVKEWTALLSFLRQFPDTNADGIANLPESYRTAEPRMIAHPSWSPRLLFQASNGIMWSALAGGFLALLGVAWIGSRIRRRITRP